jgi:hypothetical protein
VPPCTPPPEVAEAAAAAAAAAAIAAARAQAADPGVLSEGQASSLRENAAVRAALQDPALCDVVARIDAAADPVSALEREMQDPEFSHFADVVLEAIGANGAVADKRDRDVAAAREELARLLRQADQ